MSPPPTDESEGEALTPTQLTIKPVKPTDGGGRGTKFVDEDTRVSTTGDENVLEESMEASNLVSGYNVMIQGDQNYLPEGPISPERNGSTSTENQNIEKTENTTPSVELSTGESQLSEPKSELQCSYDKKGKCRLHAQLGKKTVREGYG